MSIDQSDVERSGFYQEAERRYRDFLRNGKHYSWEDMSKYVLARARGESPKIPAIRTLSVDELRKLNKEHVDP